MEKWNSKEKIRKAVKMREKMNVIVITTKKKKKKKKRKRKLREVRIFNKFPAKH